MEGPGNGLLIWFSSFLDNGDNDGDNQDTDLYHSLL